MATACDESFEPIAPTELAFSVFGYLDASADTQWLRVMPIRPLKVTSQDALGATVTLEHLGTGQVIRLRDSLFRFSVSDPDLGPEDAYFHNFWTTEAIEPGATYRFSASREGWEPAEAIVEIPPDYHVEVAISQVRGSRETDELRIVGLRHLPFLRPAVHFYDGCGWGDSPIRYERRSDDDTTHLIAISKPGFDTPDYCGPLWVADRELRIVGSEAAWPAGGYTQQALGASALTSNVTNAVGFIGGILTKVVPYEQCEYRSDGAPIPHYCELRYDPETVMMRGTVSETRCGDGPIDSVTVRLTEMDRDPARIRTILSNGAGHFLIGSLEPGIPHVLWMHAPQHPIDSVWDLARWRWVHTAWEDIYTLRTDTLTFVPGEQLEYDIHLERLTPCSQRPAEGH